MWITLFLSLNYSGKDFFLFVYHWRNCWLWVCWEFAEPKIWEEDHLVRVCKSYIRFFASSGFRCLCCTCVSLHSVIMCAYCWSDDDEDKIVWNVECHYSQAKVDGCTFNLGDCAHIEVNMSSSWMSKYINLYIYVYTHTFSHYIYCGILFASCIS